MPDTSTYSLFRDLENSLRSLVGTEESSDYNKLAAYLSLAKKVHDLGEQFRNISKSSVDNQHISFQGATEAVRRFADATAQMNVQNNHRFVVAPGSPAYFVYNDELIKLGATNSGDGTLYKKSVPLSEVEAVCQLLCKLLSKSSVVSVTDIRENLGPTFPTYKIQTILLALVASGGLAQSGRGKYSLKSDAQDAFSSDNLIASLRLLPVSERALHLAESRSRRKSS